MEKSIVMCSGKGGAGKSCVAAYTAEALARQGRKTLLVELGGDARSLDLILGEGAAFGVRDAVAGHCDPREAVAAVGRTPGLFFIPPGDGETLPEPTALRALLRELEPDYDFILIDGAPPEPYCGMADLFLMVTTPDSLSVRACAELSRRLYAGGAREINLIINDVPPRVQPIQGAEDFDGVIDRIGARLLGVAPQSPKLRHCANSGLMLDEESLTLKVFENIAGRLMGRRVPLLIR